MMCLCNCEENNLLLYVSVAISPGSDSCLGESSESVSVCSEASSSVRRDSDVEVISNPSVSSIEVINDQHIIHG